MDTKRSSGDGIEDGIVRVSLMKPSNGKASVAIVIIEWVLLTRHLIAERASLAVPTCMSKSEDSWGVLKLHRHKIGPEGKLGKLRSRAGADRCSQVASIFHRS